MRETTDDPSVHIATVNTTAFPGTEGYVAPSDGVGEATSVARFVAGGLADGTLGDADADEDTDADVSGDAEPDGETEPGADTHTDVDADTESDGSPSVAVVFRRRTHMDAYVDAFEEAGLSVVGAQTPLFETPAVAAVCDVVAWLATPDDPDALEQLVRDSRVGLDELAEPLAAVDWDLSAVLADEHATAALSEPQVDTLERLQTLRVRHGGQCRETPGELAAAIVTQLELQADPYDLVGADTGCRDTERCSAQRVQTLDALLAWLRESDTGEAITPAQVAARLAPLEDAPHRGPTQTTATAGTADVVCTTIHQMKGDEADTVVLATPGFDLWAPGTQHARLLRTADVAALAPPETGAVPPCDGLPGVDGLYRPATGDDAETDHPGSTLCRDRGLRWATERWADSVAIDAGGEGSDGGEATDAGGCPAPDEPTFLGHDHLQQVAHSRRAESWRLLYVALSRARNHLVVPLPQTATGGQSSRDRWLETLRAGLDATDLPRGGRYTITATTAAGERTVPVGVNDVTPTELAGGSAGQGRNGTRPAPHAGATPIAPSSLPAFAVRILRPSTFKPLADAPDRRLLAHLRAEPLHTATGPTDEGLPFDTGAVSPEAVGEVVHGILTHLIRQASDATRPAEAWVSAETIAARRLHAAFPDVAAATREGLLRFVTETVFPQVAASEWWQSVQAAPAVYVEKPLPARIRHGTLTFEFDGTADVVVRTADGSWTVLELKVSLGALTPQTRARYRLQVATYGYLLEQYVDGAVTTAVETVGVTRESLQPRATAASVLERLARR